MASIWVTHVTHSKKEIASSYLHTGNRYNIMAQPSTTLTIMGFLGKRWNRWFIIWSHVRNNLEREKRRDTTFSRRRGKLLCMQFIIHLNSWLLSDCLTLKRKMNEWKKAENTLWQFAMKSAINLPRVLLSAKSDLVIITDHNSYHSINICMKRV